jgi:hypothetical protein
VDLMLVLMVVVCLLGSGHSDDLGCRDARTPADSLAACRNAHPIRMAPSHGAIFVYAYAIGAPPTQAG